MLAAPEGRAGPLPEKPGREIVDQINLEFVPHVKPVVVGSPVYFPNKDDVRHHVYSFSPAKRFELPLYSGTPAAPVVFDRPGIVAIGCNIHDWMLGYIYVAETPSSRARRPTAWHASRTCPPAATSCASGTRAWRGPKRRRPVP